MPLTATFTPLPPIGELAQRWQALEARAGQGSFFLGWTWMESWLTSSGATPELLSVKTDGEDVALALVGRAMVPRLLGSVATLSLNQSGIAAQDRGFIEYNGLLIAADAPDGIAAAAMNAMLARHDWRALQLCGVAPDSPFLDHAAFRRSTRVDVSPAYYIDLAAVRAAGGDYLSLLSTNSRSQIKRSLKDHGVTPNIAAVSDAETAERWLGEMQALNEGRHADNAWDDASF
ncbi:MAG: GNAT family N-acetyltransferase, partial [Sphingobium sp.]